MQDYMQDSRDGAEDTSVQVGEQSELLANPAKPKSSGIWSALNVAGKLPGLLSNGFWFALVIDTIGGLEDDVLGVSKAGLITGLLLSTYSTLTGIYCEYIVNTNNSEDNEIAPDRMPRNLTKSELLLATGYAIDQLADKSASAGLMTHILGGDSLNRTYRALIQTGLGIFAGFSSVADVKTVKANLKSAHGPT